MPLTLPNPWTKAGDPGSLPLKEKEVWAEVTWEPIFLSFKGHTLSKAEQTVTCVAASPRGSFLATGSSAGATLLWGLATEPAELHKILLPLRDERVANSVQQIAWGQDSSQLIIGDSAGFPNCPLFHLPSCTQLPPTMP